MVITVSKNGFISLKRFETLLDIKKISYYTLKEINGVIELKFYDKNKGLIKFYGKNKEKSSKKSKKIKK